MASGHPHRARRLSFRGASQPRRHLQAAKARGVEIARPRGDAGAALADRLMWFMQRLRPRPPARSATRRQISRRSSKVRSSSGG
jgi:hypothetical protein